uniref:Uncharacterized protein n=1 Tax=viral metagenome TaxID=1070528 RepID=A0A6C0AYF2_9ZZZZ
MKDILISSTKLFSNLFKKNLRVFPTGFKRNVMIISILLLILLWLEYKERCEKSKELTACYSALLQQQKKINELEAKLNGPP